MLVVSDTDDVFLPKPTDLLVNLGESRAALESLLGRINDMFQDNLTVGSAMGPALQAGFKLMVRLAVYSMRSLLILSPSLLLAASSSCFPQAYRALVPAHSKIEKIPKFWAPPRLVFVDVMT